MNKEKEMAKKKSEENGVGAPTKYKKEYEDQVYKLCLLGAIDKEIAEFFNVCEATINNWKIEYPEFLESIKKGKQIADANVADRLYQRALGFEHDSEEIKVIEGDIERVQIRKVYPPDPTSAIFWLKNRQPKRWRDKVETKLTGDPDNPIEIKEQTKIIFTRGFGDSK